MQSGHHGKSILKCNNVYFQQFESKPKKVDAIYRLPTWFEDENAQLQVTWES